MNYTKVRNYNRYKVNTNGEVLNDSGLQMKVYEDKDGYLYYKLLDNENNSRMVKVHRLIYDTFIENIESDKIIDHIDRDRKNNNINNLRIVSKSTNCLNRDCRKLMFAINLYNFEIFIFDNQRLFKEKLGIINGKDIETSNLVHNFKVGRFNDLENKYTDNINFIVVQNEPIEIFVKDQEIEIDYNNTKIKQICPKLAINTTTNEKYVYRFNEDFAKQFDLQIRGINNVLSKNNKTHKGFTFKYLDFFYKCDSEINKL